MDQVQGGGGACNCKCHAKWMTGLALIIFGGTYLLEVHTSLFPAGTFSWVWPILVILFGIKKFCTCCKGSSCGSGMC